LRIALESEKPPFTFDISFNTAYEETHEF
jgi:hypothetical protein